MSALTLMAQRNNRWLEIDADDTVILSSHPIPGNEMNVSKVIDGLVRLGAEVVHSGVSDVHASGHAKQEELKTLLSIVRPDHFVPVHGEYRHMVAHAKLARAVGAVPADEIHVCTDGDQLVLGDDGLRVERQAVPSGYLFVDGIIGDVGQGVLRDRRVLAEEGVVVVVVTVDVKTGAILVGPEVITRGWVYAPEAEPLLAECADAVRLAVKESVATGAGDIEALQKVVAARRRPLRQRVHEAPADDRAGRHRSLTRSRLARAARGRDDPPPARAADRRSAPGRRLGVPHPKFTPALEVPGAAVEGVERRGSTC